MHKESSVLRIPVYPVKLPNDRGNPLPCIVTILFDSVVSFPAVIVDSPLLHAFKEAFVKLQDVPQMASDPMWSHPYGNRREGLILDFVHQNEGLLQPFEVRFNKPAKGRMIERRILRTSCETRVH